MWHLYKNITSLYSQTYLQTGERRREAYHIAQRLVVTLCLSFLNCGWLLIREVQWFYWTQELLVPVGKFTVRMSMMVLELATSRCNMLNLGETFIKAQVEMVFKMTKFAGQVHLFPFPDPFKVKMITHNNFKLKGIWAIISGRSCLTLEWESSPKIFEINKITRFLKWGCQH